MPLDDSELMYILRKIGMSTYVDILFPAMVRDRDISVMELCQKYPKYCTYKPASQNSRRSNAKRIFDNGLHIAALKSIIQSSRTTPEVRAKAQEFILKYKNE